MANMSKPTPDTNTDKKPRVTEQVHVGALHCEDLTTHDALALAIGHSFADWGASDLGQPVQIRPGVDGWAARTGVDLTDEKVVGKRRVFRGRVQRLVNKGYVRPLASFTDAELETFRVTVRARDENRVAMLDGDGAPLFKRVRPVCECRAKRSRGSSQCSCRILAPLDGRGRNLLAEDTRAAWIATAKSAAEVHTAKTRERRRAKVGVTGEVTPARAPAQTGRTGEVTPRVTGEVTRPYSDQTGTKQEPDSGHGHAAKRVDAPAAAAVAPLADPVEVDPAKGASPAHEGVTEGPEHTATSEPDPDPDPAPPPKPRKRRKAPRGLPRRADAGPIDAATQAPLKRSAVTSDDQPEQAAEAMSGASDDATPRDPSPAEFKLEAPPSEPPTAKLTAAQREASAVAGLRSLHSELLATARQARGKSKPRGFAASSTKAGADLDRQIRARLTERGLDLCEAVIRWRGEQWASGSETLSYSREGAWTAGAFKHAVKRVFAIEDAGPADDLEAAVHEAGEHWAARLREGGNWGVAMRQTVRDIKLQPANVTEVLVAWDHAGASGTPDASELWYKKNRPWVRKVLGVVASVTGSGQRWDLDGGLPSRTSASAIKRLPGQAPPPHTYNWDADDIRADHERGYCLPDADPPPPLDGYGDSLAAKLEAKLDSDPDALDRGKPAFAPLQGGGLGEAKIVRPHWLRPGFDPAASPGVGHGATVAAKLAAKLADDPDALDRRPDRQFAPMLGGKVEIVRAPWLRPGFVDESKPRRELSDQGRAAVLAAGQGWAAMLDSTDWISSLADAIHDHGLDAPAVTRLLVRWEAAPSGSGKPTRTAMFWGKSHAWITANKVDPYARDLPTPVDDPWDGHGDLASPARFDPNGDGPIDAFDPSGDAQLAGYGEALAAKIAATLVDDPDALDRQPSRLADATAKAVASAGPLWAEKLGDASFEKDVQDALVDLGGDLARLTRALSAWEAWPPADRPTRATVLWSKSRPWLKRAAGLGPTKRNANRSSALGDAEIVPLTPLAPRGTP